MLDNTLDVIFDLDGTLVDSAPPILFCLGRSLESHGLSPSVALTNSIIGPPLKKTLEIISGVSDEVVIGELADEFKRLYDTSGYRETELYPGVDALLHGLKNRGLDLHIATNKRLKPTRLILEYFGWTGLFSTVYASDSKNSGYGSKTEMIEAMLKENRLGKEAAVYIGDRVDDKNAADSNEIEFIAALWGYQDEAFLLSDNSFHKAESPAQIADILLNG